MKAIVIDDETSNVENLRLLLAKYCPGVNCIGTAGDVDAAVNLIRECRPDLIFLDIRLGQQSGFDVLTMLPDKNFEVVFVTAFDQYGIQAIKFAALDYLLKPVAIPDLLVAVKKAQQKLNDKERNEQLNFLLQQMRTHGSPLKIALPQAHEIRYVNVADIVRCEAEASYTYFYLTGGERLLISRSIKEYADLLSDSGFLRTHQSHLVNISCVKSWLREDGGTLLLHNGDKIPVSRPNRGKTRTSLGLYER